MLPRVSLPPAATPRHALVPAALLAGSIVSQLLLAPSIGFALAAWLGPVFMLRFVRSQPPGRGYLVGAIASAAAALIAFRGVYPGPQEELVLITVTGGFAGQLVFLLDRLVTPRLSTIAATLVLPAAATALDFLTSFSGNVGTFTSPAYSQVDNLPLLQVAAVAGIWPITFLFFWFAAVANAVWEHGGAIRRAGPAVAAFGAALLLLLTAGGVRLALAGPAEQGVRVAAIGLGSTGLLEAAYLAETGEPLELAETLDQSAPEVQAAGAAMDAFWQDPDAPRFAPVRATLARANERLLEIAAREAAAGARIVAWSEANAMLFRADEAAFLARAGEVARAHGIYLVMGIFVVDPAGQAGENVDENKVVIVDPTGAPVLEYWKTRLAPGETSRAGDGTVPTIETPYGTLAAVICWDADFPGLVRRAGQQGVDLLVVPSGDWAAITPWHARVAAVRGVENGLSVLRPVRHGLLLAADPYGRLNGSLSYFAVPEPVLVTTLNTAGFATPYARLGDWFAWLCVAGAALVTVVPLAVSLRRRVTNRRLRPGVAAPA